MFFCCGLYPHRSYTWIADQPSYPRVLDSCVSCALHVHSFGSRISHLHLRGNKKQMSMKFNHVYQQRSHRCKAMKMTLHGHAPFLTVYWITKVSFHNFGSMLSCCNSSLGFLHPLEQIFFVQNFPCVKIQMLQVLVQFTYCVPILK